MNKQKEKRGELEAQKSCCSDAVCLGERDIPVDRKVISIGWKGENRLFDESVNKMNLTIQCSC